MNWKINHYDSSRQMIFLSYWMNWVRLPVIHNRGSFIDLLNGDDERWT